MCVEECQTGPGSASTGLGAGHSNGAGRRGPKDVSGAGLAVIASLAVSRAGWAAYLCRKVPPGMIPALRRTPTFAPSE